MPCCVACRAVLDSGHHGNQAPLLQRLSEEVHLACENIGEAVRNATVLTQQGRGGACLGDLVSVPPPTCAWPCAAALPALCAVRCALPPTPRASAPASGTIVCPFVDADSGNS